MLVIEQTQTMPNKPIGSLTTLPGSSLAEAIPADTLRVGQIENARSNSPSRNAALDFTKGALVLIMVLYHWLSYFHGPQGAIYKYLRFLPPSFIFISGFLISNAYLAKYQITDPRLPKRLVLRGLKILGVFVVLNATISFVFFGFRNLSMDNLEAVYVTGNVFVVGVGKAASFYILVPISYLLLLSAILLIACRFYKYTFYLVFGLFSLGIFLLNLSGLKSGNLELVTIGLLGLILGYIPIEKINAFVRHPYLVGAAYLGYTAAITYREPNYPVQVVGVCLTLMLIYLVGTGTADFAGVRRQTILLGKYPLFGYIAQIAILQFLRAGMRRTDSGPVLLVLSFIVAVVLTVLAVTALDRARSKSPAVNRMYNGIFA
jgi:peptidoglycan/LPS O-acetylase OafA/YrhL